MLKTTRFRRAATLLAAATLTLTALTACGSEDDKTKDADASFEPALKVDDAWVRATEGAKDTTMTAAFMVLTNTTGSPFSVTGATSDVSGMTEFHDMVEKDGTMVMTKMEHGVALAPETGAILQPGGKHVMLMDMKKSLSPGDEVTFTLTYGDNKTVSVTAPVKAAAEEEGHYHEPGTGEHGH